MDDMMNAPERAATRTDEKKWLVQPRKLKCFAASREEGWSAVAARQSAAHGAS
jgi:hypothetical protein